MPVSIRPGQIALTRMLAPQSWVAATSTRLITPALRRRISRPAGAGADAGDAGGADDRAAAALLHHRRGMLDREKRTDQVDPEDLVPVGGRLLEDRGEPARNAGIGEEDVEPAMLADRAPRSGRRRPPRARHRRRPRLRRRRRPRRSPSRPRRANKAAVALPIPDAAPVTIAILP